MTHSTERDFDFLIGTWQVRHRRLRERLKGCEDWQQFDGTCVVRSVLGGQANVDDNVLDLPGGGYRAVTLRAFDPHSRQWTIWWLDSRRPGALDVPLVGGFADGVGIFHANDVLDGRAIRVRFRWTQPEGSPRWEQAFSADAGATWEVNWTMDFVRTTARE